MATVGDIPNHKPNQGPRLADAAPPSGEVVPQPLPPRTPADEEMVAALRGIIGSLRLTNEYRATVGRIAGGTSDIYTLRKINEFGREFSLHLRDYERKMGSDLMIGTFEAVAASPGSADVLMKAAKASDFDQEGYTRMLQAARDSPKPPPQEARREAPPAGPIRETQPPKTQATSTGSEEVRQMKADILDDLALSPQDRIRLTPAVDRFADEAGLKPLARLAFAVANARQQNATVEPATVLKMVEAIGRKPDSAAGFDAVLTRRPLEQAAIDGLGRMADEALAASEKAAAKHSTVPAPAPADAKKAAEVQRRKKVIEAKMAQMGIDVPNREALSAKIGEGSVDAVDRIADVLIGNLHGTHPGTSIAVLEYVADYPGDSDAVRAKIKEGASRHDSHYVKAGIHMMRSKKPRFKA